ncbi:MAG TPA: hypothetical protein VHI93_06820 [Candidatus Thermoplasmatota archaeon]|nr:hypothetical protein [Candidatus Thermoplasmatota archaeon]
MALHGWLLPVALVLLPLAAAAAPGPGPALTPTILMGRALQQPSSLHDPPSAPPPDGPALPTIQDGIGPGSGLRQGHTPDATARICTAAFLLRDPATATYYLSTAGHCLVRDEADPTPYTGAANPDKVNQRVDICVAGCIGNALGMGTYVSLVAGGGYAPVTYAESGGPGKDFGIVEIPAEHHGLLRPWMPQFGGPTGVDAGQAGDTFVHYGHGSYCCPAVAGTGGAVASRTPADQGRIAVSLGASDGQFSALGSSSGGDSGSGVALGRPDPSRGIQGTAAVGVLTHGVVIDGVPYYIGTTLAQGLGMVRATTGMDLELVLQDDPLPTVPDPNATLPARIAILTPPAGATVRPGGDGTATIQGTAGRGNRTPPPGALVQVAIDDAAFSPERRVPVLGNATWSGQWDLHGVAPGPHTIHARLVDASGRTLAAVNHTVTVAARGSPLPGGTPSGPGSNPSPGATGGLGPGGTEGPGTGPGMPSGSRRAPLPPMLPPMAVAAAAALLRRKR